MRAKAELVWLVAILGAFGAVCFATLGLQSFDSGETITASRIIHPSYADTFTAYSTIERSGPLYYTLAWGWSHLFGLGEVALRSLSAIFGLGTIVAMFFAGRELFSKRAGVLAAALVACDPDVFWYSQEARSYPLFILLTATGLYFFIRALKRPSRGAYIGWAVAGALALCTHYFSAFPVGFEALWLLAANRRRIRAPLIASGAVLLVGLALLPLAIHQQRSGRGDVFTGVPVLERGASALVKFVAGEITSPSGVWVKLPLVARDVGLVALALFAAAIVVLFLRGRPTERRLSLAVGTVGGLAFLTPLALALAGQDYVEPRNLVGSLAPLLLLVAGGAEVAIRGLAARRTTRAVRLVPALALVAPLVVMVAAINAVPKLQRADWRAVSQAVRASGPARLVLTDPPGIGKSLTYFLGERLPSLTIARYPCGVTTRRIVTVSGFPARPGGHGFRLVSARQAGDRYTIAGYRSRHPVSLSRRDLRRLELIGPNARAFVDGPSSTRAGVDSPSCTGTGPANVSSPSRCSRGCSPFARSARPPPAPPGRTVM